MKLSPEILDDIEDKNEPPKENKALLYFGLLGSLISYFLIVIGKEIIGYIGSFIGLIFIWKSNTDKDSLYQAIGLFLGFVSLKVIFFFLTPEI